MSVPLSTFVAMTKPPKSPFIAGEPTDVLLEALFHLEFEPDEDGMFHVWAELPPHLGSPFSRALMRAEAELLEADVDALGAEDHDDHEERTADQRRCDAFVLLSRRVFDAYGPSAGSD